jgi:hypothetical protein
MIKYHIRVQRIGKDTLIGQAFQEMENLEKAGLVTWTKIAKHVIPDLGINLNQQIRNVQSQIKQIGKAVKQKLKDQYIIHFREAMLNQNHKLDTYK